MSSSVDNRTGILRQALKLLAARGYDGVGVQWMVEAVGCTKPTLYHYFGSKRGLLEALLSEHLDPFVEELKQAAAYRQDLPLTLDRVAALYFRFASEQPDFYRMLLGLWFTPPDSEAHAVVTPFLERQFQLHEELFKHAAKQHGNMKGRQRAYAVTFLGMLNTYIGMSVNGHLKLDEPLRYQAVHQFLHGVFS